MIQPIHNARSLAVLLVVTLAAPLCPQEVDLDESWTVTVGGRSVTADPDGGFFIGNVPVSDVFGPDGPGSPPDSLSDTFFRVMATSTAGGSLRRAFSEPFQIRVSEKFQVGEMTLDLTVLESIRVIAERSFLLLGETSQLTVTGTQQDGALVDVTSADQYTVYRTSNPRVASVDARGLVTARGRGTAFIATENSGITALTRMDVASATVSVGFSGLVELPGGALAAGALILVPALGLETTARADGTFELDVDAPLFATISIVIRFESGGQRYSRTVEIELNELDLEQIDVGSLALRLVEPPIETFPQRVYESDNPFAMASADLDGDADVDLVGVDACCTVGVLLNAGNGVFENRTAHGVGQDIFALSAALGDLDADGDADMIVKSSVVSVFPGHGDGNFGARAQYDLLAQGGGAGLAVLDLDRDGVLDIAAADGDGVTVLENVGNGTFATSARYPLAPHGSNRYPPSIAAGDLDADGAADIIAAVQAFASRPANVSVLRGLGDGTFAARVEYPLSLTVKSIAVSDLDGDDVPDVAAANTDAAAVLLNTGIGTLAAPVRYLTGTDATSISAGDLDADGRADLAVANAGSTSVSTLRNFGDGTFAAQVPYVVGGAPGGVILDDFDGDGDRDLAVANAGEANQSAVSGNLQVLRNLGAGTLANPYVQYLAGESSSTVALGDLDGDTRVDLAAMTNVSPNNVAVLRNLGAGTLGAPSRFAAGGGLVALALGDLDGDGDPDLAGLRFAGFLSLLRNQGNATFAAPVAYGVGTEPNLLALGDVDGDGDADAVTQNSRVRDLSVLRNRGDATFEPELRGPLGRLGEFALGDLDGDGNADLAVVWGDPVHVLAVLQSRGDGTFDTPVTSGVGLFPSSVALGDLDGDGDLDVAVGNLLNSAGITAGSTVSVLFNLGAATFETHAEYGVGSVPRALALGDLDRDGRVDIVAAGAANLVSVLRNVGEGAFAAPVLFGAVGETFALSLGDLDGDGDPDLAAGCAGGPPGNPATGVSVLFNQTVR